MAGTPPALLRALGTFVPMLRELAGTVYQFSEPFVIDDAAARRHFGVTPQPWDTTMARIVEQARVTTTERARG